MYNVDHCTHCGDDGVENVDTIDDEELQGYSRCCNEIVTDKCDDHCSHEY